MSALCAGGRLCSAALWCRAPPAGCARNLFRRRIQGQLQHCINRYSESQEGHGGGGQSEAPQTINPLGVRTWRRRRSLSPLDRVSGIIPPDFISQEIRDLQNPDLSPPVPPSSSLDHPEQRNPPVPQSSSLDHPEQCSPPVPQSSSLDHPEQCSPPEPPSSIDHPEQCSPPEPPSSSSTDHPQELNSSEPPSSSSTDHPQELNSSEPPSSSKDHPEQLNPPEPLSLGGPQGSPPLQPVNSASSDPQRPQKSSSPQDHVPSQGVPLQAGDLLLAEFKRRHYSMFRKMFVLKNTGKLVSNWGAISYQDLLGKLPGVKVRTSSGHQLLLKRPSLDEYVIYMKRGPTISYPKDVASMLLMMDVNPGDVILEAGSGSGALSLFLSRAVGSEGRVHSIEVRRDHHHVAKSNFLKWKDAWEIGSGRYWPDNVNFINKDVVDALSDLRSIGFDAVALDMLNPQVALPAIIGNLKQGGVCAVYITNITQVIDLLEGIRSCKLPLSCEKVLEVSVTDWLVAPSRRKDGKISKRVEPKGNRSPESLTREEADDEDDGDTSQTDDEDLAAESQPFGEVPYIARPMPWQIGHTAFLVQLRKIQVIEEHTEAENI